MKTELLAPAKNITIAKAAIDCGADAVYIGADNFGARKNASNSIEDIKEIVEYAHKFYVKVYVTVNTIVSDGELGKVKKLIRNLYDIGADALIIQDMSILKAATENEIPPIPLHISTQCDNRFDEKIKFFKEIGVTRVVLARELPLERIEKIVSENPELDIEVFIHGALCVSYSGQCYLSQYIGGRSANRGECAQPCRKKYSLVDDKGHELVKDKHLLSLKDFCASSYIKKLVNIGVKSFKIEGRLKDELYVRNVTGFYRGLLDECSSKSSSGKVELGFVPDLDKSFNRGYTDYFLSGRCDCFNFNTPKFTGGKIGHVVKVTVDNFTVDLIKGVELSPQDGLYFNNGEGCLINTVSVINGEQKSIIYPNKMPKIKKGAKIYRNIDIKFENSVLKSKTRRKIGVKIEFSGGKLTGIDEDNNRTELEITENEPAKNQDKMNEIFEKNLLKTGETDFYVTEFRQEEDIPFLPMSAINRYRRCLLDNLMKERIKNYKRNVQKPLKYAKYYKDKLDYRSNVHNKEGKLFYERCGAKVAEMSVEMGLPQRQIELMRTKHCIKYALNMCGNDKELFLKDDRGAEYPLGFDCKNCEMTVLSPQKSIG